MIPDDPNARLGSLHEADLARTALPADVHRLVVVTSPVHARRSGFTFRRRLASRGIAVTTYAAIDASLSAEAHAPLWLKVREGRHLRGDGVAAPHDSPITLTTTRLRRRPSNSA